MARTALKTQEYYKNLKILSELLNIKCCKKWWSKFKVEDIFADGKRSWKSCSRRRRSTSTTCSPSLPVTGSTLSSISSLSLSSLSLVDHQWHFKCLIIFGNVDDIFFQGPNGILHISGWSKVSGHLRQPRRHLPVPLAVPSTWTRKVHRSYF